MYRILDESGACLAVVSGVVRCRANKNGTVVPDANGGGFIARVNGRDVAFNVAGCAGATMEDVAADTDSALTDAQLALCELYEQTDANAQELTNLQLALTEQYEASAAAE